jgi:uncharacterized delta-60 repeat protein
MKKLLAGRSLNPPPTRRLRPAAAALLALLLMTTTLTTPAGAAADLDPTFGTNGLVTTDFGATETANAAAVQADGKIIVAGIAADGVGASLVGDICVLRYKADGSLDTAFGGGGRVLLDFGETVDSPAGVLVQSDGKLVVVGGATKFGEQPFETVTDFVLARLNPDGTPDNTFGTGGKIKTSFDTPFPAYITSAAIQPDGRFVVAGIVRTGNDPQFFAGDFFAARFNADGTPDATFGTQGRASLDISDYDVAVGVALQADGKIVLAGMSGASLNSIGSTLSFALARLKADGTPDATFDGDGRLRTTFYGYDYANGVAIQADGKIVAAGTASGSGVNFVEPDFALARYEANGALDPTFGAGGRVTLDFGSGFDSAVGVAAAPNGRILAGGYTSSRDFRLGPAFAAARLNPGGSPDNTFGAGGRAITRFPDGYRAFARGAKAQPDGKLILVGEAQVFPRPQDNTIDIALARYGATPAAEPTSFARFSAQTYGAVEGCTAADVTVTREGDLSAPAAVEYRTRDISARQLSDYTHMAGTLNFAAGESSKSFAVPVNDDAYSEVTEAIGVELVGGSANVNFRVPAAATLSVTDDDPAEGGANPLDNSQSFVCQHYHDFLSRQPDAAGLQFWTQGIESCGSDAQCREVKRIDVSTAFFLSIEFQQTGYFVIRAHKAAFGNNPETPRYFDFLRDTQRVAQEVVFGTPGADARLEANRQAFAAAFVARPEFLARHGNATAEVYVDSLFLNAGVTPSAGERAAAVAAFGAGGEAGRAAALRSVVESDSVYRRLYNAGFVLSQYFGYLRRGPEDPPDFNFEGYDFWLAKLDSFSLPGEDVRDERVALARVRRAEMVKAFVTSVEYRRRFGQP